MGTTNVPETGDTGGPGFGSKEEKVTGRVVKVRKTSGSLRVHEEGGKFRWEFRYRVFGE